MRAAGVLGGLAIVAGSAAGAIHPLAAIGVVLGVVAIVWVLSSPFNATLAFLIVLIARPADLLPGLEVLKPAKLLAISALGLWLLGKLLREDLTISRAPHGKWMVALGVAVLLSTLMSSHPAASMALFTDSFVKILIMYALVVHLVDDKERAVKLHVTLSLCTTGLALYALHEKITGVAMVEGSRAGFVGLLGDPNDLALVLVMYVPFLMEAALATTGVRRSLLAVQLLILVAGLVSTLSRGGLLGLAAAMALVFHDRGSLKQRVLPAVFAVVAVFGAAQVAGVAERASGRTQEEGIDESAQARLDAWKAGGRMVMRHPLLGVGFGRFSDNYEAYVADAVIWGKLETHNSYIKVASETGALGFVPFMMLVGLTLRGGYRLRKRRLDDTGMERAVRRAMLPAMCGFCICAFFLSQSWSWFFFIMFAQGAAMHDVWSLESAQD